MEGRLRYFQMSVPSSAAQSDSFTKRPLGASKSADAVDLLSTRSTVAALCTSSSSNITQSSGPVRSVWCALQSLVVSPVVVAPPTSASSSHRSPVSSSLTILRSPPAPVHQDRTGVCPSDPASHWPRSQETMVSPVTSTVCAAVASSAAPGNDASSECIICLDRVERHQLFRLSACHCRFCKQCMSIYVKTCLSGGEATVACPDADCELTGLLTPAEINSAISNDFKLQTLYHRIAYIQEVERDPARVWCPRPGCDTACQLSADDNSFTCSTCKQMWCLICRLSLDTSSCQQQPHASHVCRPQQLPLIEHSALQAEIKACPDCGVLIERDEGCAQIMCRRCRHVFCWYCLHSLDGDFFLRHYDVSPCRELLGHSRRSLIWHRFMLVGVILGLSLIVLVSVPALVLLSPFLLCCSFLTDRYSPADAATSSQDTRKDDEAAVPQSQAGSAPAEPSPVTAPLCSSKTARYSSTSDTPFLLRVIP